MGPLTDTLLSPMELGMEPLMDLGLEPAMDFLSVPVDTTTTTDMDFTRGLLMLMPSLVMLATSMVDMLLAELDMVMVLVVLPAMSTEAPRDIEVMATTMEDVTMVCTRGPLMLATSDMLPTTTMAAMHVASSVFPGPSLTTASAFTTKHQPKYATNVKLVST